MYGEILTTPGVARVYLATIVGRLPMGALGLLMILRTQELTGSYAAGGAVAATFAIASGIGSPLLGRMVDRRGQAAVLVPSALWSAVALAGFALLPAGSSVLLAGLLAAASGAAMAPLSACQRAIWSDALEPRLRHTAYALDSVVFELVYITGPLVLVGLMGAWSLQAALLASAALGAVGAVAFAATRLSRAWHPHPHRSTDPLGPLRGAGVRTVLLMLALIAVGVAATEIAVAAFADDEGSPHLVGLLLALWGVGSMIGGLVLGRRPPSADPARRLALLVLALALLEIPTLLAGDLVTMAVAMVVAGVMIAPAMALAFHLLSEVAPAGTVTEAQTWVTSGFGAGIAAGSALGGWVVEHAGTTPALAIAVAAGLAAAALVATRRDTLRPDAQAVAPGDGGRHTAPEPVAVG